MSDEVLYKAFDRNIVELFAALVPNILGLCLNLKKKLDLFHISALARRMYVCRFVYLMVVSMVA